MSGVARSERLESLDILRGFDMFFIFLPDPAPCVVAVFLTMIGLGNTALSAPVAEFVGQVGLIALGWILLHYLYRKLIFLRV